MMAGNGNAMLIGMNNDDVAEMVAQGQPGQRGSPLSIHGHVRLLLRRQS
jgi:hypothetical protein